MLSRVIKREKIPTHAAARVNLENIKLSERSQPQKSTCRVKSLAESSSQTGSRVGGVGEGSEGFIRTEFQQENEKVLETEDGGGGRNSNASDATKLYTLKRLKW